MKRLKMIDAKRTSVFLMANLGSEIARLFSAVKEKNESKIKTAKDRAIKILEEIERMPDMASRNSEINIIREIIMNLEKKQPNFFVDDRMLAQYFQPFALRVLNV